LKQCCFYLGVESDGEADDGDVLEDKHVGAKKPRKVLVKMKEKEKLMDLSSKSRWKTGRSLLIVSWPGNTLIVPQNDNRPRFPREFQPFSKFGR
jgi:hypothetical protein